MLDIAWKNMWTRKTRTILTIVGIAIALELVIMMTTIVDYTQSNMQGELSKYSGAGQMYVRSQAISGLAGQEFPPINSVLKEAEGRQIISQSGAQINPKLSTPVLFYQLASPPYPNAAPEALLAAVDVDKLGAYVGENPTVDQGVIAFSAPDAREVVLGPMAAAYYGKPKIGDDIQIIGQPLRVVGLLGSNGAADRVTANVVMMPLKTAQTLLVRTDSISAVLITSTRLDNIVPLAESIRSNHSTLSVLTQAEIAKNLDAILGGERFFFNLINYTVYIVAAVVVLIVMIMAVSERTKEIGTLRAIGASRGLVLRTIVIEAIFLGLIGSLLSIPIAFLLDWAIGYGLRQTVNPVSLIQIVITAVMLSAVAAFFPSYKATKINPIEALRYE